LNPGEHGEIIVRATPMEFDVAIGIASDPATHIPSEEEEEQFEAEETVLRLNDPAFATLDDEEDEE